MGFKNHLHGTAGAVKIFGFLVCLAAIVTYFIAAVVLLSDGVSKANAGACCIRNTCNARLLPESTVAKWPNGGVCQYTAADAALMGCAGTETTVDVCGVTNRGICDNNAGRGLLIATGVIGIVLAVALAAAFVLRTFSTRGFVVGISISGAVSIVEIVIAGIAFHYQRTDQNILTQVARQCARKVNKNCVSYNYAEWFTSGANTCPVAGVRADLTAWNMPASNLKGPVAVLLFAPIACFVLIGLFILMSFLCPRVVEAVRDALESEPSAVVNNSDNTTNNDQYSNVYPAASSNNEMPAEQQQMDDKHNDPTRV